MIAIAGYLAAVCITLLIGAALGYMTGYEDGQKRE